MYYINILIIFVLIYGVVMSDEEKRENTSDTKKVTKKYTDSGLNKNGPNQEFPGTKEVAKKYTDSGLNISGEEVVYEGNKPGKVVSPRLEGQNRGNLTF